MESDTLKRVEAKLDLVLDLLQDKNLTNEEITLIRETDECVRDRKSGEFTKLWCMIRSLSRVGSDTYLRVNLINTFFTFSLLYYYYPQNYDKNTNKGYQG